jgi:hypothetical protein
MVMKTDAVFEGGGVKGTGLIGTVSAKENGNGIGPSQIINIIYKEVEKDTFWGTILSFL